MQHHDGERQLSESMGDRSVEVFLRSWPKFTNQALVRCHRPAHAEGNDLRCQERHRVVFSSGVVGWRRCRRSPWQAHRLRTRLRLS